jgi:hypothetical protein
MKRSPRDVIVRYLNAARNGAAYDVAETESELVRLVAQRTVDEIDFALSWVKQLPSSVGGREPQQ